MLIDHIILHRLHPHTFKLACAQVEISPLLTTIYSSRGGFQIQPTIHQKYWYRGLQEYLALPYTRRISHFNYSGVADLLAQPLRELFSARWRTRGLSFLG